MLAMLQLCHEEESMGLWSAMTKSNRDQVRHIRRETWGHLESVCAVHDIETSPELLSSAAGEIPFTYSEFQPNLEDFKEIVWAAIQP